ncbi:MAG: hypothetical protein ACTHNU_07320 [Gaiellales bacterium]
MRVRSPIGDLPFTVSSVRLDGREVVVHGELGAWRSQVRMSAADLPMLARALRVPLAVAAVGLVATVAARRR